MAGSFLGNSPKERRDLGLAERTVSLWSHTNQPQVLRSFLNPIYEPNHRVIWPSVAPMSLVRPAPPPSFFLPSFSLYRVFLFTVGFESGSFCLYWVC